MSIEKETGSGKETGTRRTVAEARGLTPEQLIEKSGLSNQMYRGNLLQEIGMDVKDGESVNSNTKIIMKNLEIANLPEIDLMDAEQVRNRIREYFTIEAKWGYKPTVAGLGNALNGLSRQRLWEIRTGNTTRGHHLAERLPKSVRDEVKKAYHLMEQNWEDYMQNGKINPVAGIFLGKNNYGYQDRTDYVITPNENRPEFDENEIRERLRLSDSDSDSDSE